MPTAISEFRFLGFSRPRASRGHYALRIAPALLLGIQSFLLFPSEGSAQPAPTAAPKEDLFETKIRPLLTQNCYPCHSHENKIRGGFTLDSLSGLKQGGESGPAIAPGNPEGSLLVTAVSYTDKDLQMPPDGKLPDDDIALLVEWVKSLPPNWNSESIDAASEANSASDEWERVYRERLDWWSLQPLSDLEPPAVEGVSWPHNEVDRFILAALEENGIAPVMEADRRTLARRLSFALTGLPPEPEEVDRFAASESATAYDDLAQSFLDSPHFGERWARHWMDVTHYSDTHGYEWDVPAKNAWMYRDYLVRAFNDDISFKQLVLEQIAGDLIEPRVSEETGIVESLIGPAAMRLGERRHGDNADAEGISQEAVDNMVDTLTKGFIGTTVACARCHDHKLDAVEQRDYYALAGVLMSGRWIVRSLEAKDPNMETLSELKEIKKEIREKVIAMWRGADGTIAERIRRTPNAGEEVEDDSKKSSKKKEDAEPAFPETLEAIWGYMAAAASEGASLEATWRDLSKKFQEERERRVADNQENLRLLADFTREELPGGWSVDGFGMKHGRAANGDIVLSEKPDKVLLSLLPAGRWTHLWSQRFGGALRSPLFAQDPAPTVSIECSGRRFAGYAPIVDNALHSERLKFLDGPELTWIALDTGNLQALAGSPDPKPRRVYLEIATKSFNNYFPPRHQYGGLKDEDEVDPRSWFGVTRVYQHPKDKGPADVMSRFVPLFSDSSVPSTTEELVDRLTVLVMTAIDRWTLNKCDSEDVRLINEALWADWAPNELQPYSELESLVAAYRETEKKLQPDRTIGSVADWNEGENERIGVRGSYTALGDEVPRGNIRFLGGPGARAYLKSSGRLELARNFASDNNPLTARVFVNRVWHYLFGQGLVRTVDNFGQYGAQPSHPELLDWLARRFIDDGWSLKKLVRLLVTSAAWRQNSIPSEAGFATDPENRFWHHIPLRRLEAESIRDSILAVSGGLDDSLFGPPIDPFRAAEDPTKRLYSGPIDGNGRRSLYLKMTLMEPPKFLALFNQPIPKFTTGARDTTNVPNQALALLNNPFATEMARQWSERLTQDLAETPEERVERMIATAFARPSDPDEMDRFTRLAKRCAELRGADPDEMLCCQPVWQDVAHAIFNLKEFIYVQ
jgi:cytochrome c553